jgi:hypothetical protein
MACCSKTAEGIRGNPVASGTAVGAMMGRKEGEIPVASGTVGAAMGEKAVGEIPLGTCPVTGAPVGGGMFGNGAGNAGQVFR